MRHDGTKGVARKLIIVKISFSLLVISTVDINQVMPMTAKTLFMTILNQAKVINF